VLAAERGGEPVLRRGDEQGGCCEKEDGRKQRRGRDGQDREDRVEDEADRPKVPMSRRSPKPTATRLSRARPNTKAK